MSDSNGVNFNEIVSLLLDIVGKNDLQKQFLVSILNILKRYHKIIQRFDVLLLIELILSSMSMSNQNVTKNIF